MLRMRFSIFTPSIRYLYQRFVEPTQETVSHHLQNHTDHSFARNLLNRSSFVYELHRARHLLAKDPRDHVYAFLGHFSLGKAARRWRG